MKKSFDLRAAVLLLVAGGLLFSSSNAFAAPNVVNGSFEMDSFSFNGNLDLGGTNPLTGWTTLRNGIYPWGLPNSNVYNAGPTPYGNQWVIVGDFGQGGTWIEQTVGGFTVGQTYTLSFALASEVGQGAKVEVSFPTGSSTASQIFQAPLRGANFWDTWGTVSMQFVADMTSVTIRFTGLAGPGLDAGIDNVSIVASVPSTVLDHFKCYSVDGKTVGQTVSLSDQFEDVIGVQVKKPTLLCNPVDKNGEGIVQPLAHLVCYTIKEPHFQQLDVAVNNQFGADKLKVKAPELLCVPSTKQLACGSTFPQCGGFCPKDTDVCQLTTINPHHHGESEERCQCGPPAPKPCGSTFPQCGGFCPNATDVCQRTVAGGPGGEESCQCGPPAPKPCGSTFPQCGGFCLNATDVCQPTVADGSGCHCVPRCCDVFWNIFDATGTTFLGQSSFNLCCTDTNMDTADDCGKSEGNNTGFILCSPGNSNASCINEWSFAGVTDGLSPSSSLDCFNPSPYVCTKPITSLTMQWNPNPVGPLAGLCVDISALVAPGNTVTAGPVCPGDFVTVSGYQCQ